MLKIAAVIAILVLTLTTACSQPVNQPDDPNLYQPADELFVELRALYEDPNQTRFNSQDGNNYEFYGRITQIDVEIIPDNPQEALARTGEKVAFIRVFPNIVCITADADNPKVQQLEPRQTAVLNGELLTAHSFHGLIATKEELVFRHCKVVVADYTRPTATPKPTRTPRPTFTPRSNIDADPILPEEQTTEQEFGLTRNNCYTFVAGLFHQHYDKPITTIFTFEEYEPGNPDPITVYRNQDETTLKDPFRNIIPGQKPFDGLIHLTTTPLNFPSVEGLAAGILKGTIVVNAKYDNLPEPIPETHLSFQYQPDCQNR